MPAKNIPGRKALKAISGRNAAFGRKRNRSQPLPRKGKFRLRRSEEPLYAERFACNKTLIAVKNRPSPRLWTCPLKEPKEPFSVAVELLFL
jgi:hypothetical protein